MPTARLVLENLAAAKRMLEIAVSSRDNGGIPTIGTAVALRDAAVAASRVAPMSDAQREQFDEDLARFDATVGHQVGPVGDQRSSRQ